MATGLKLNGVDFEDIFEKTRDSSNEKITNLDYNFQTSGAGLYSLRNFLSADPAKPYQSVGNGGSIDLSSMLVQSPLLENLVLKGRRPRFDRKRSWSYTYGGLASGAEKEVWVEKTEAGLLVYNYTPGTRTLPQSELIPKSKFPDGIVPDVVFFAICGGGAGGAGGGGLSGSPGGGGGGGAVILGWTYTFYSEITKNNCCNFIIEGGGVGGTGGAFNGGNPGKAGGSSRVIRGSSSNPTVLAIANGGKGGKSSSGGAGGTVSIVRSSSSILLSISGGKGAHNGDATGLSGYYYAGSYDPYYIGGIRGFGKYGGGGSLGPGGNFGTTSPEEGESGGGGAGGYIAFLGGKTGNRGGSGEIRFFY